ncbi:MAG: HAMP domain-containing histidine kinase, partial [Sciscionella sp.]|nr:HAMP domain-containing histidine kinase [Sciscionella sp.]
MKPIVKRSSPRRRPTLRRRLTVLTAAVVTVAVVGLSVGAWLLLRIQLLTQVDQDLREIAQSAAVRFNPAKLGALPAWAQAEADTLFGVVSTTGVARRPASQPEQLPATQVDVDVAIGKRNDVLREVTIDGTTYRMLTVHSVRGDAVQVAQDMSDTYATLNQFAVLLACADVVIVICAAALGYALTRAGLRPVDRVRTAAEHVAGTQDLDAAVTITPDDPEETASVASSVNAILTALGASRDAQRQLVEDAGHELATPLTSLRTNIDLLLRAEKHPDRLAADDRRKLLGDIHAQTDELTHLIEEVVELARDTNSTEEPTDINISEVVNSALIRAGKRTPDVTFEFTDNFATHNILRGRRAMLERAVLNLLDNAAKWNPPNETVNISTHSVAESVEVVVADRGPGVPKADLPMVFERFYRSTESKAMPGSGLGLAI